LSKIAKIPKTQNQNILNDTDVNDSLKSQNLKYNTQSNLISEINNKEKRQKILLNSDTKLPEEKSYTSRLVTSIPVRISIEFDRKAKVQTIIDNIKNLKELELEKNSFYTNLILLGNNLNFINPELKIDECFQNNQTVDIYEFLNYNGLNEIIWKNDLSNEINLKSKNIHNISQNVNTIISVETELVKKNNTIIEKDNNLYKNQVEPLNFDILKSFKLPILDYNCDNKEKKFEYLIEINHRFVCEKDLYIFDQTNFNVMYNFFFDALILNNSVN